MNLDLVRGRGLAQVPKAHRLVPRPRHAALQLAHVRQRANGRGVLFIWGGGGRCMYVCEI